VTERGTPSINFLPIRYTLFEGIAPIAVLEKTVDDFARRHTLVAAGSTASQVASGGTIIVHGINVSNSTASAVVVTVLDVDGNTLDTIRAPANDSKSVEIRWLADNGLAITTPSGVTATVYHSQPGA